MGASKFDAASLPAVQDRHAEMLERRIRDGQIAARTNLFAILREEHRQETTEPATEQLVLFPN